MLNLFNRKELVITRSMARQARICELLTDAGIEYSLKVRSLEQNRVPARENAALPNSERKCEYKFYVRKEDFSEALHIIER